MKKYIQIIVVLGLFSLLVVFRNVNGKSDATPVVVGTKNSTDTTTATPTQSQDNSQSSSTPSSNSLYKDGTYTGSVEDVFYGNYQVQAIIVNGKISDIQFLQYPNDNRTSLQINEQSMPMLKEEALKKQSANVDTITGASDSSMGFQKSLANALQKAS